MELLIRLVSFIKGLSTLTHPVLEPLLLQHLSELYVNKLRVMGRLFHRIHAINGSWPTRLACNRNHLACLPNLRGFKRGQRESPGEVTLLGEELGHVSPRLLANRL